MAGQPTLLVIGGPNGSGKTTALDFLARAGRAIPNYANADEVARSLSGDLDERNTRAQIIVRERRDAAIASGSSFSYETVMSHHSHVEAMKAARANGFFVQLVFVTTDDPALNVARVANRVAEGGHDVPRDRIIGRYRRIFKDTLFPALVAADEAYLFDTTRGDRQARPQFVAHLRGWHLTIKDDAGLSWPIPLLQNIRTDPRFVIGQ